VLGAAHFDALASQGDLAQCLEQLGRRDEAAARRRRVAALHQERAVRRVGKRDGTWSAGPRVSSG
jgi:hypothetical protein